ncbi:methylmalonyl Co-A mutase-associated GTPase MeaB [Candidatus Cloacimonadaceae bacterium]
MSDKRKPEWAPENSGKEFASHVLAGGKSISSSVSHATKAHQARRYDLEALQQGVLANNRTLLSKAITLIESNSPKHFEAGQELIKRLLPHSGKSIRIGITGVPGAGKSTFIESFGLWLIRQGHKVAVLAVDPSSTISKGSILGDKTRMEELSRQSDSFIRPSPSAGILGGVARKTRESIVLCEAAGYDVILIETVGVGQSETTVRSMVDFFLLMQIAGAGDELQGIKKGIIELADLIVVNKADGDNVQAAQLAAREYNNALHYLRRATNGWHTKALTCSAINKTGISEIWEQIVQFRKYTENAGILSGRRREQNSRWFESLIAESVLHSFYAREGIREKLKELTSEVENGLIPVAMAVSQILENAGFKGHP